MARNRAESLVVSFLWLHGRTFIVATGRPQAKTIFFRPCRNCWLERLIAR
jgi:hypothetical protein